MDKDGLQQAKERLLRLRSAAGVVRSSAPLPERESAWLDVLQYLGTIYSKLEQGAKPTPSSKAWFDAKRHERKTDELLKYLQHARNAGEHSIKPTSGQAVFAISGTLSEPGQTLGFSFDPNGKPIAGTSAGVNAVVHENEIMLQAAVDRGVTYILPRSHLGQAIQGLTASEATQHALAYAETMIAEAERLTPSA